MEGLQGPFRIMCAAVLEHPVILREHSARTIVGSDDARDRDRYTLGGMKKQSTSLAPNASYPMPKVFSVVDQITNSGGHGQMIRVFPNAAWTFAGGV
jgi:hypothetical protein